MSYEMIRVLEDDVIGERRELSDMRCGICVMRYEL
jgi:hypothetical protein